MGPGTAVETIRVLVADDHPVVREGVAAMLGRTPDLEVTCQCSDGREAVAAWGAQRPHVGLLDVRMPGLGGIEAVQAIRQADPGARLVVMSTLGGDESVYRALQAGAAGYVLKDCGAAQLAECIRAVHRGQRYLDAAAAASLAARMLHASLTPRETEVLARVSLGLSNKRIARELDVAEGTVKTHMKSLLGKLDARTRTEAIRIALARGLVHAPEATR